jgi:hypothetical protein
MRFTDCDRERVKLIEELRLLSRWIGGKGATCQLRE